MNASATNNVVTTDAGPAAESGLFDWQVEFCNDYASAMFDFAWWYLAVALAIGTIGALIVLLTTRQSGGDKGKETGGATAAAVQVVIQAIQALVEAFAKAPTWLAMFGGGVLLMWMAGNAVPSYCTGLPPEQEEAPETNGAANESAPANEQTPAQNGAGTAGDESGG